MQYVPLKKIYYQDQSKWKVEYTARFNSNNAKHLNFFVKEHNYKEKYQTFFCYTQELAMLQNNIMTAALELVRFIPNLPGAGINQFLQTCLFEEIQFSNKIEGVRSSRKELTEAYLQDSTPVRYVRLWGIVNKYKKIIEGIPIPISTCADIRKLYDDFILQEIQRDNPKNLPDGKIFRKDAVEVITKTQRIIHTGIFPEDDIILAMQNALDILHDKSIPSLIRISIFHYLFGYIHPFYDGNGRMARFISSYFLAKELDVIVAMRLSVMIKSNISKYYSAFSHTNNNRNCGDLTPFITQSLTLVLGTIQNTHKSLVNKLERFKKLEAKLPQVFKNSKIEDKVMMGIYHILLQGSIFSNYGATVEDIASTLHKSRNTITKRLAIANKEHFIEYKKDKPYCYKLNLKILENINA